METLDALVNYAYDLTLGGGFFYIGTSLTLYLIRRWKELEVKPRAAVAQTVNIPLQLPAQVKEALPLETETFTLQREALPLEPETPGLPREILSLEPEMPPLQPEALPLEPRPQLSELAGLSESAEPAEPAEPAPPAQLTEDDPDNLEA